MEKFTEACMEAQTQQLMQDVKNIIIARKHKAFQPETKAHQRFLNDYFEKTTQLQEKFSFLNLTEELVYFSQT